MSPQHIALAVFVAAIWGFNFIAVHYALQEIPPVLCCAIRFIATSIPAIFFFKRPRADFRLVLIYGVIMFALQFSLMFVGLYLGITAALGSIILQTQAFFSLLFACILFKEKLNKWQILGAIVSFSGIGVVALNVDGNVTLGGLLFVLSAAFCWGMGSILVKKMGAPSNMGLIVWASFIAWPILLVASYFLDGPDQILQSISNLLKPTVLISMLYIILLSTCTAFVCWNWLINRYPVTTVAPFTLLVPFFGMLGAAVALGEVLQTWKLLAGALVLSGVGLHQLGSRFIREKKISPE